MPSRTPRLDALPVLERKSFDVTLAPAKLEIIATPRRRERSIESCRRICSGGPESRYLQPCSLPGQSQPAGGQNLGDVCFRTATAEGKTFRPATGHKLPGQPNAKRPAARPGRVGKAGGCRDQICLTGWLSAGPTRSGAGAARHCSKVVWQIAQKAALPNLLQVTACSIA